MEYMPGRCLSDCLEDLTFRHKLRTAIDLANIMSSMFKLTAPQCSSMYPYMGGIFQRDPSLGSLRYPPLALLYSPRLSCVVERQFCVGPLNDLLLDYPRQIDPRRCGPFDSECDFMEAAAFWGKPPTRPGGRIECGVFEKVLEVYEVVQRLYGSSENTLTKCRTFHFAHGDLSDYNILIDPNTGAITGVIDWEMARFRPACIAGVGGGWFDDGSERFLMTDFHCCRGNHVDETPS